jgi:hypothetical protein
MRCPICKSKLSDDECLSCEKVNDYKCEPDSFTILRKFHNYDFELQAKGEV